MPIPDTMTTAEAVAYMNNEPHNIWHHELNDDGTVTSRSPRYGVIRDHQLGKVFRDRADWHWFCYESICQVCDCIATVFPLNSDGTKRAFCGNCWSEFQSKVNGN